MMEFFEEDKVTRMKSGARDASYWIALGGWALIGSTLNIIIFSALPVKLIQPEWQLQLISTILSQSYFILLGSLLVCGAVLLNLESSVLRKRSEQLRWLAGWFAILLILIVPLQFYSGIKALRGIESIENQRLSQLAKVIQELKSTKNESEFRIFVAGLPNRPQLPATLNAPFLVFKERALNNLTSEFNKARNQVDERRLQRLETFISQSVRNSIQAVFMALAFNGMALSRSGNPTLLQTLLRRIGLNGRRK
jgi:hypothetical protein